MSADLLREAAALMRERAEAANDGPWEIREGYESTLVQAHSDWPNGGDDALGQLYGRSDARHIASWHPAVALAVADWLEATADRFPPNFERYLIHLLDREQAGALAVADAYLGSDQ